MILKVKINSNGYMYRLEKLLEYAEYNGWTMLDYQSNIGMVSFDKNDVRLNVYVTTLTCGTALDHPRKGKTQLFRQGIPLDAICKIFKNPRCHSGRGYYERKEQR